MARRTQDDREHAIWVGLRLKQIRTDLTLSQADVAKLIGCQPTHYARYERGDITLPLHTFAKIVRVFGAHACDVLGIKHHGGRHA